MEITVRDAITVVHGMFFGALLLLSFLPASSAQCSTRMRRSVAVRTSCCFKGTHMSDEQAMPSPPANGPGAAAVLAAAIGACILGVVALAADSFHGVARALTFWKPTGPLSGVTDVAIVVWLASWLVLSRLWARRTLDLRRISLVAALLIIVGLLLTFPPFMDFVQGK